MGVLIKSKTDGFRRGGIVHRAKGTFYRDGALTDEQLEQFSREPQLVMVVQESPVAATGQDEESLRLIQQMGDTIAGLEHDLDKARAGLNSACSDLMAALERQKAAPGLVVEAVALLEAADPTQEGVIIIKADNLVALITELLQPQVKAPEAQDDANRSTLSNASGDESPNPAPVPPVASPDGAQAGPVAPDKGPAKRGKAAQKEAD
ncbi:HI1506-related protein [Pseudomonas juntendi]|uniref:HI1506-related protein n=1 Tax=Pseudomonas juntendi TaxID=2666183 RepID=UPI002449963F|nr:HI1506-related protein [Pseudomonas juntendi]MDG9808578.1 HI1506-related protein [Pseudomonas juntendi]